MAINPVRLLTATNATAVNGSPVITITGNIDTSRVYQGTVLHLDGYNPVEALSGTSPDGSGVSTITLREDWAYPNTTGRMTAFNTIEGLVGAIEKASQVVEQTSGIESIGGTGLVEKTGSNTYVATNVTTKARTILNSSTNQEIQGILGLGTTATLDVTISPTDDTPDRVLKVGDFGLGAPYVLPVNTDLDNVIVNGIYGVGSATTLNRPVTTLGSVLVLNYAGIQRVTQVYYTIDGRSFIRSSGGVWGAWEEVATGANNALITSGTNSNGSFTMFPDGTMICQRTSLSSSAGGDITWTFPAVFSSTPATSVIAVNSGDLLLSGNITSSAVSSVSFNIRDVSEGRVTTDVRLTAIGRWN